MNKVSSYRQKMMGLILTISLLLSFLPASRLLADGTQPLNVESYSACAFQNDLSLVYYYKIKSPGDFTNIRLRVAYQRFDYNNPGAYTWETSDIRDYTYDPQTQMYRFVFKGIAAAEMGNTVRTAFCANIGNQAYASPEQRFSIKQYAEKILELKGTSTDEKDKLLCTLVVDMLNYGAAAQKYFGRNVSALVNANLTEVQKKMGSEPVSNMESIATIEPLSGAKAAFKFASVEFNNTVDLVTYIQMTGDLKDTVYAEVSYTGVDGQTRTSKTSAKNFKLKDGFYGARFSNIAALYFRSPLKIVIKDGNTAISPVLNYSFESYVRDINIGDYKESMKELGRYMLAYGDSAYKYFTYSGSGSGSENEGDFVKYSSFKQASDPDDYNSIVRAHEYANEHNLPVKADEGATYRINHMDPRNPKGALIKTPTDWGDAKFIIDDSKMTADEGACYLFTVAPTKEGSTYYLKEDCGVYFGIDPRLKNYPLYNPAVSSSFPSIATQQNFLNQTFSKETTQFQLRDGERFEERNLFVFKTMAYLRWGRFGSATASDPDGRNQQEIIIVDKDGRIDPTTKLQWDWKEIYFVEKYPIDEVPLTVTGGTFTTIVNVLNSGEYVHRGISVTRSNVTLQGVKHYLTGEDAMYVNGDSVPRLGAPHQGFFRIDHCAYVTLKDCVFSNHKRVFNKGDNTHSTAPYDYYAEYAANITIDHCVCAPTKEDSTGIMDSTRWGTTGTNYCKTIVMQNYSSVNRIDAHKGTYNLVVKDSTLGTRGVAAVGFGDMYLENVTIHADHFITLRNDYGSAWFGNIYIKNCTWDIGNDYTADLIQAIYDPENKYCYEPFEENGITYYSALPTVVDIDGLTIDAREIVHIYNKKGEIDHGPATVFYTQRGFNIYTSVLNNAPSSDEAMPGYLADPEQYKYPLCVTKQVNLKNLKVIKNPEYADYTLKYVTVRNPDYLQIHDELLFANTKLNFEGPITYEVAEPD